MLMVRGRPSLLTTVTSLGADVGTEEIKNDLVTQLRGPAQSSRDIPYSCDRSFSGTA